MYYGLDRQTKIWIQDLEEKLTYKLEAECRRLGSMMPYVPENELITTWVSGN